VVDRLRLCSLAIVGSIEWVNLSCDAVKWSGSGQVTVTLRIAAFQMPESSPWVLDVERVVLSASARVVLCLAVHYLSRRGVVCCW
jgi:hypothetical protein